MHVLSITVTDPHFGYLTTNLTIDQLPLTLGRSTFADISEQPDGQRLELDGRRAEYFYFGNASYNQHYILSHNDAGHSTLDRQAADAVGEFSDGMLPSQLPDDPGLTNDTRPLLAAFRAHTIVNTLTIGAPHLPVTTLARESVGLDPDHVRALRVRPAR